MDNGVEVTLLIAQARSGDQAAAGELFAALYGDLHQLAKRALKSTPADRLRATSLVHEAYLRMARPGSLNVNDRQHLMAVAARAMRQLVIDHARQRNAEKRGGGVEALPLDQFQLIDNDALRDADLLALDEGLQQLHSIDPQLGTLVELRFFAGLEIEELVELTGRSASSLKRDWRKARAFLHRALSDDDEAADS